MPNKEIVSDVLPEELTFICKLCHIAANKRMVTSVECGDKNITGHYCSKIERLRRALLTQSLEIDVSRKYINLFKTASGKTVFRKQELEELYKKTCAQTAPDFNEFLDYCSMNGIEVIE